MDILTVDRKLIVKMVASVFALAVTLCVFNDFLTFVESRPGIQLVDPILLRIPPQDVTWPIFGLIYGFLFMAIAVLLRDPSQLLVGVQAYSILTLFRLVAMYLISLAPPEGMIVLRDPLVELFGSSRVLTKDLFFSGHTSLVFLLGCLMNTPYLRALFFLATLAIGCLVIIQHVHYTIDVVAAPFFSYAAYRLTLWLRQVAVVAAGC